MKLLINLTSYIIASTIIAETCIATQTNIVSEYKIVEYPADVLKVRSEEVSLTEENGKYKITDEIRDILYAMKATLFKTKNGIGIAAPQCGLALRLVVISIPEKDEKSDQWKDGPIMYMINPTWKRTKESKEVDSHEGCLSLPGIDKVVKRYNEVEYQFIDIDGNIVQGKATDLRAFCIQHEVDHLDGKMFIDRLNAEDKEAALRLYYDERNSKDTNERFNSSENKE